MDLALYRKYRPKSFREVVGQEHVVKSLQGGLELGKTSHAYLFVGPRGTGKTTMARLLAKTLNCEKRTDGLREPCNQCFICQEFNEGRNLDLTEIDAASNRGIDEIRNLRESVRFGPTHSKYKVYVIDECLTGDHLVTLADGRVKLISEFKNGDEVASVDLTTGTVVSKKVSNWFSRNTEELVYIRTPQATLKCTLTHRLWIIRDGAFKLVLAKDVKQSDFLPSPILFPHQTKNRLTPGQLSFLALIQCDGHISKDSATIQVEIRKDTKYFEELFTNGIKAWGTKGSFSKKKTKRGTTLFRYYSLELKEKLIKLGCPQGKKSNIINIPDEVFQAPLESIKAYIDACFCCEGEVVSIVGRGLGRFYKLNFTSTSKIFSRKLQLLLKKFGVSSSFLEINKKNKKHHNPYRVGISGYDLRLFHNLVGLTLERKAEKLKKHLESKEKQDGIPIQIPILAKRAELNIPHSFLKAQGIYLDKTQGLTRRNVEKFISITDTLEFNPYLNFRYEKILEIKRKKETAVVYDFTVEDTHTFLANGICSSNCHQLTDAAFNALLKTLEEPPSHAIFILASTEPQKIPDTISSRTQQFNFRNLTQAQILDKLNHIAKSEKLNIDDEALGIVALSGHGSLRDAESNLSKLISFGSKKITLAEAQDVLGFIPLKSFYDFTGLFILNKKEEAVNFIGNLYEAGVDLEEFSKSFIDYLRKLLISNLNPATFISFAGYNQEEIRLVSSQAKILTKDQIVHLVKIFIKAREEMRISPIQQLPLELAVIEYFGE